MSSRRKIGRFGAVVAAVLLAASTLALPSSSQPAITQQGCTPSEPNAIQFWINVSEFEDRGVTLCRGDIVEGIPPETPAALLQIVDLSAGAKLRLISDEVQPGDPFAPDNQYHKREAFEWFDWIQSNTMFPAPDRLFSTTNASFFINTSGSETALSLPEKSVQEFPPPVIRRQTVTSGWAFADHDDPAWDAEKRGLVIGNPTHTTQLFELFDFPTQYSLSDVDNLTDPEGNLWDATVAFQPLFGSGAARRTFLGWDGVRVYILAATSGLTLGEAQDILRSFGSQMEIQLDGGGSTQTFDISSGGFRSLVQRDVPDVLAVYLAPE